MADIGESIGEVGGTIRAMLGLTQHSRLRDQIRGTTELYAATAQHPGLAEASSDLAEVIIQQTHHLAEISSTTRRSWNWGALFLCWTIAGGLAVGGYFLAPRWGTWWATLLTVVIGLVGVLFVIAGFGTLLQRKADTA
jgi:hypothetical protein